MPCTSPKEFVAPREASRATAPCESGVEALSAASHATPRAHFAQPLSIDAAQGHAPGSTVGLSGHRHVTADVTTWGIGRHRRRRRGAGPPGGEFVPRLALCAVARGAYASSPVVQSATHSVVRSATARHSAGRGSGRGRGVRTREAWWRGLRAPRRASTRSPPGRRPRPLSSIWVSASGPPSRYFGSGAWESRPGRPLGGRRGSRRVHAPARSRRCPDPRLPLRARRHVRRNRPRCPGGNDSTDRAAPSRRSDELCCPRCTFGHLTGGWCLSGAGRWAMFAARGAGEDRAPRGSARVAVAPRRTGSSVGIRDGSGWGHRGP